MSSPARSDKSPELIWLREEPGARRPTHSRAQIAAAAVEIADREGFDAVSMRRVAQSLGAGTMTLYHYVSNKDELVTLMHDAVMGEVLVAEDELPEDWREAITAIARSSRDAFKRHRWTLDRIGDVAVGPNGIRHFEQSLRAVAATGLPATERLQLISTVDEFVMGFSLRESVDWVGDESHGKPDWPAFAIELLQHELDTGNYPLIRELMEDELIGEDTEGATRRVMEIISDPSRFERGLKQLLDGVEAGRGRG